MNHWFILKMQILKDSIRQNIDNAGLKLFARQGFNHTTVAEIADAAGISTGNIYKYYDNKHDLLYSLVSPEFVAECLNYLSSRIAASAGRNPEQLAQSPDFARRNADFIGFMLQNRLRLLVLMNGCNNTAYQNFCDQALEIILAGVFSWFASVSGQRKSARNNSRQLLLRVIYQNLISTTVALLKADTDEKNREKALHSLLDYHLSGIAALA